MSGRNDNRNGRLAWVQIFVDSFRGRLSVLSPAGAGAYMRLFLTYLDEQGPLVDDDRKLARIVGVTLKEWRQLRAEVEDVMEVRDGHFHDHIADERIANFKERSNQNRQAAEARHAEKLPLTFIYGGKKSSGAGDE